MLRWPRCLLACSPPSASCSSGNAREERQGLPRYTAGRPGMESGACSANLQSPRLLDARQVRSLSRSSPQLLAAPLPLAHTRSLPPLLLSDVPGLPRVPLLLLSRAWVVVGALVLPSSRRCSCCIAMKLLLALVAVVALAALGADGATIAEVRVLEEFYQATGGAGWGDNSGWLDGDPCSHSWHGVQVRAPFASARHTQTCVCSSSSSLKY